MSDEITLDAPETRIERFLAAAAGVEGITLDEPETRIERYLYKIAQGGGGSGGGPLVVHATPSEDSTTLDKTWKEIKDADAVSVIFDNAEENARNFCFCSDVFERVPFGGGSTEYCVTIQRISGDGISPIIFVASSASGYPSYTME